MNALLTFKAWLAGAGIAWEERRYVETHVEYHDVAVDGCCFPDGRDRVVRRAVHVPERGESTVITIEGGYSGFYSCVAFGPDGKLRSVEAYE